MTASLCLAYGPSGSGSIGGGAIANVGQSALLKVTDSELSDNDARGADGVTAFGGAIYTSGGPVVLRNVALKRNSVESSGNADAKGAGIANEAGESRRHRLDARRKPRLCRRGVRGRRRDLQLGPADHRSTLSNNGVYGGTKPSIRAAGGGLYNFQAGDEIGYFNVGNSTITGNYADIDGTQGIGGGMAT